MAQIILIEIGYFDPTGPTNGTIRISTGAGYDHPSAPGPYRGCVANGLTIRRSILENEQAFGGGLLALAEITAINTKLAGETVFPFDFLVARDCAVDGRAARFLLLDDAADYATAKVIATGECETFALDLENETVTFRWRDEMAKVVDQPVQLVTYAGTNSGSPLTGVEGVADIKDQWKPWLVGYAGNFTPILVNSAKLLYQISDLTIEPVTIGAVRDRGATLAPGVIRASLALLQSTPPAVGSYDVYPGSASDGCYIRLGSTPTGAVTCDAWSGATVAKRTLGQLFRRTLIERLGVTAGMVSAADIAALDATETAPIDMGWWCGTTELAGRDLLDRLCQGRAVYWRDEAGTWRIKPVASLGGSPLRSFVVLDDPSIDLGVTDLELFAPSLVPAEGDSGLPYQEIAIGFGYNFTRQSKDSLAGVALPSLQLFEQEQQIRRWTDTNVATRHPRARRMSLTTAIRYETDAASIAASLGALLGVTRRRLRGRTPWIESTGAIQLAGLYAVRMSRIGLGTGKAALLTRLDLDLGDENYDLELWGLTWP